MARLSRRSSLFALGTLLAGAALAAAPASLAEPDRQCYDSAAACGGVPFLLPGHVRLMVTFVPLKDGKDRKKALEEYAKLLPPGFSMPQEPGFQVSWNDAHVGTDVPIADQLPARILQQLGQAPGGTTWRESGLQMIAAYTGKDGVTREGSLELAFATNGLIGYLGRPSYPKYYADVTFEAGANGLPAQLADPRRDTYTSSALVAGPTTGGAAEPTATGTFTPSPGVALPEALTRRQPDFRLSPNDTDGGGTHQGPDVLSLRVEYKGAAPVGFLTGQNLGVLAVPGVTDLPEKIPGQVHVSLDPQLARFDEQSPEPIPDELWKGVDLSQIIDLDQTLPGYLIDGQFLLHSLQDEVVGRGGCASTGTCTEPLQVRPARAGEPPAQSNSPTGVFDGGQCVAAASPAGPGSCEFATSNPRGGYASGLISGSSGHFEVRALKAGCQIRAAGRAFTGSFGLVYPEPGGDVFRASGAGIATLTYDDECSYRLTALDGSGAIYAGQTN